MALFCPWRRRESMLTRIVRLSGGALLLVLAACSAAPAPQVGGGAAGSYASIAGTSRPSLVCHPGATTVAFSQLGLPEGEIAVGVALTPESVWVLFQPSRLVRLSRTSGDVRAASRVGAPGEVWTTLAADDDGSIWVGAQDFGLGHFGADLAPRGKIRLSREVIGNGGLARLVATGGTLYAEPACGEFGIWRIAPDGKVLGTDFRAPQEPGPIDPDTMNCAKVTLLRDAAGRVVVLDGDTGKALRTAGDSTWAVFDSAEAGLAGCTPEAIFVATFGSPVPMRRCQGLIYWKGRPLLAGWQAAEWMEPRLAGEAGAGPPELRESCYGDPLREVVTDATGYAAITQRGVIFGDFAGAPDLP